MGPPQPFECAGIFSQFLPLLFFLSECYRRDEYDCMKSMVNDYTSVRREIKAYEALSKAPQTSWPTGKQDVRQALDHFKPRRGDRDYYFLIHEPLGATVQFFLNISSGSLPILLRQGFGVPDAACFGIYPGYSHRFDASLHYTCPLFHL